MALLTAHRDGDSTPCPRWFVGTAGAAREGDVSRDVADSGEREAAVVRPTPARWLSALLLAANATSCGLIAAIWTSDLRTAHSLAREIRVRGLHQHQRRRRRRRAPLRRRQAIGLWQGEGLRSSHRIHPDEDGRSSCRVRSRPCRAAPKRAGRGLPPGRDLHQRVSVAEPPTGIDGDPCCVTPTRGRGDRRRPPLAAAPIVALGHRESLDMASEILLTRGTSQREQFIDLLEGKTEKEVFDPEEPPVPVGWAVRWDRQPADVACAGSGPAGIGTTDPHITSPRAKPPIATT